MYRSNLKSCIDIKILQKTAELLSIRVPKVYSGGTYISDFSVIDTAAGQSIPNDENATVHRLYAKKRGRKTVERDNKDLIVLEQNGLGMKSLLDCNLLEVWGC